MYYSTYLDTFVSIAYYNGGGRGRRVALVDVVVVLVDKLSLVYLSRIGLRRAFVDEVIILVDKLSLSYLDGLDNRLKASVRVTVRCPTGLL